MPKRKIPLVEDETYHIISKSIAGFVIFRNESEYERMKQLIKYYKLNNPPLRFSAFLEIKNKEFFYKNYCSNKDNLVEIISYCLMPTHIHLVLRQLQHNGISTFLSNILNSYTKYFNAKTKRKGPLWESRFKNVFIKTEEQILHVTRYLHLNPITAYLAKKPQDWNYSSYKEFLEEIGSDEKLCDFSKVIQINSKEYIKFVESQIDYQRKLAECKKLFIE
ncbi:MAG: transposase [Candidatus Omnitrophica bacterium]|nr:transposase [Candidatus Omnitrophota bacterium]